MSALRVSAITVGGIAGLFAATVFVFREQVFSAFVADRSVLAIGVTILTAQLVAMIVNGFTGLLTSLFQATGRALPATVMSVTQGVLFIPIVILGNLWFGLAGIIWALTVTEGIVLRRRCRAVARVPSRDRPRPRRGQPGARRRGARAGRGLIRRLATVPRRGLRPKMVRAMANQARHVVFSPIPVPGRSGAVRAG